MKAECDSYRIIVIKCSLKAFRGFCIHKSLARVSTFLIVVISRDNVMVRRVCFRKAATHFISFPLPSLAHSRKLKRTMSNGLHVQWSVSCFDNSIMKIPINDNKHRYASACSSSLTSLARPRARMRLCASSEVSLLQTVRRPIGGPRNSPVHFCCTLRNCQGRRERGVTRTRYLYRKEKRKDAVAVGCDAADRERM